MRGSAAYLLAGYAPLVPTPNQDAREDRRCGSDGEEEQGGQGEQDRQADELDEQPGDVQDVRHGLNTLAAHWNTFAVVANRVTFPPPRLYLSRSVTVPADRSPACTTYWMGAPMIW